MTQDCDRAAAAEWLRAFVAKPRAWCVHCRRWNEVEPPAWWRGNCHHFRAK